MDEINLQYTTIKNPVPDFIYDGIREFSAGANTYKPQPDVLIEKLAKKHKVRNENIFLTAGADEGIQMFAHAYGTNAFVFTPTYVVYSDVETFGGKLTRIDSVKGDKFSISTNKIDGATLIYLANPNNPSGFTEKDDVVELIKNNKDSVVVIDEAYGDYAPELSVISQIGKYKNLAVLRSFSKGYQMAGNRVGYIVSTPKIIKSVKDFTQWANVSYLSVGAAVVALDHEKYFKKMREEIATRRGEFIAYLRNRDFTVFPSVINAVLIKFESEGIAQTFVDNLKENNIVVSYGNGNSNIGLDKSFVRISIGTDKQMKQLEGIIEKESSK